MWTSTVTNYDFSFQDSGAGGSTDEEETAKNNNNNRRYLLLDLFVFLY